jgi:hypothetical protein
MKKSIDIMQSKAQQGLNPDHYPLLKWEQLRLTDIWINTDCWM